jgi:hypothetical protein
MIYLLPVLWFIEWGDGLFREQQKKLSALETELAAAKQEGFTSKLLTENDGAHAKKRHLVVIGIMTRFGNKNNRDAVRKAWMGTGRILCGLMVLLLLYVLVQLDFVCLGWKMEVILLKVLLKNYGFLGCTAENE